MRGRPKTGYVTFEEAKTICRDNGITSCDGWKQFVKKNKILRIPSQPKLQYPEWKNWMDFHGVDRLDKMTPISYEDAKSMVQKAGIKTWNEFRNNRMKLFKTKMPLDPDRYFKSTGDWISWGEFLGTGSIAPQNLKFHDLETSKDILIKMNFKDRNEFRNWARKQDKSKLMIPIYPEKNYKEKL